MNTSADLTFLANEAVAFDSGPRLFIDSSEMVTQRYTSRQLPLETAVITRVGFTPVNFDSGLLVAECAYELA